ncbi:MAG: cobyrinic acid a,c-diamide synthase [Gammaproteobacteria bacterium]|nr:MAG: cobyrinic acid a,c-diamide synthase [Gammaproteobacteria bacterium]PCH64160.1 MAG: cobyrinic acid a,c-diamide synthase [Gammaproteobacteria bacterium]
MLTTSSPYDQAHGLRRMHSSSPVRVIAITGGKGGVGKTNISINLGVAMSQQGKRVLLLDADLGLANVDVLLGLHPRKNLSHVISGECTLDEVIVTAQGGLKIVPGASGLQAMADLSSAERGGLVNAFSELNTDLDVMLIDTAAGISDSVLNFVRAAQEVIIVVCDEPASITDAYAMIKTLSCQYGINRFRVVTNMVAGVREGQELYKKLAAVTNRFLDVALDFMGAVPYDEYLRKAIQKQKPLVEAYPRSKGSMAFKNLVQKADKWPVPTEAQGHLEFFWERLIGDQYTQGAQL